MVSSIIDNITGTRHIHTCIYNTILDASIHAATMDTNTSTHTHTHTHRYNTQHTGTDKQTNRYTQHITYTNKHTHIHIQTHAHTQYTAQLDTDKQTYRCHTQHINAYNIHTVHTHTMYYSTECNSIEAIRLQLFFILIISIRNNPLNTMVTTTMTTMSP